MTLLSAVPTSPHSPIDLTLLETEILPKVFKPGRYLGIEQGAFHKPFATAKARMALMFPDVYEIGASSYAIKLLYSVVNSHPDYLCDRVYAPAQDMRALLKEYNLPLYGVESKRPVLAFDFVAVSLQYELNYTTVLGALEAAQIPLRAVNREEDCPIVLAGGPGCSNPAPMEPFFDGFMIGDGEDLLLEVCELLATARTEGWNRKQKLTALAQLDGVYVPNYNTFAYKRVVDIAERHIDIAPLIPAVEAIHDRVVVEARRGCDRMCRFCHPAFINLPARENDVTKIKEKAMKQLAETGYEECSLLSLSIADYSQFVHLVKDVSNSLAGENASLSLSSQRADRFSLEVAEAVNSVRKSTLTFAPEAGTERLRDVINKNLSDAEIMHAVTSAYRGGWNKVKLYFMIGLPSETQADLDGIVDLVKRLIATCNSIQRAENLSKRHRLEVNVTLSNFVPKPHTPFQWHAQDSMESLKEKIHYLKGQFRLMNGVKANFTTPNISKLEAVISKGGVELADVLEAAYHNGAYLDAWDETQPFAKWFEALQQAGICPEAYTRERLIHPDEALPWDHIQMGLDKQWLRTEWERSMKATSTTPCFEACSVCGVCGEFNVWPSFTTGGADEVLQAESLIETDAQAKTEKQQWLDKDPIQKVRLVGQKKGSLRFVSHLDWMRTILRAIRRSELPVAYTQGFNPKPKLSLANPLPLFMEGFCEYVDIDFCQPVEAQAVLEQLNQYLPEEAQFVSAETVSLRAKSTDALAETMEFFVETTCTNPHTASMIKERVQLALNSPHWVVTVPTGKQSIEKTFDIHACIHDVQFHLDEHHQRCKLTFSVTKATPLQLQGVSWAKPQWVLKAMDLDAGLHWRMGRLWVHLADAKEATPLAISTLALAN